VAHICFADKRRPVLLLTRDAVDNSLNEIIVVLVARTIPGLHTDGGADDRR
jgi:mRNA-degrading endonuclease toxin of MazEF toxin-antitoxin module